MKLQFKLSLCSVLLLGTVQLEAQQPRQDAGFMGLLEFLGEFETEDGQWLDPDKLEQALTEEDALAFENTNFDDETSENNKAEEDITDEDDE